MVDSAAFANSPAAWACEVWAEVVSELAVAREAALACSYARGALVRRRTGKGERRGGGMAEEIYLC